MAYKTQEQAQATYTHKQAQGWLNLELVDKKGQRHRLPKGLALYESKIESLLIKLSEECPDKEFQLIGKVYLPPSEDSELNLDL